MKKLRFVVALLCCVGAFAVAATGCGGGESSSGLGAVLSYVPADTPFAVEIDTDLDGGQYKALDAILNRFPGADTIKALLESQLSFGHEGVEFDRDIKPLLGNPAVVSAADAGSFLSDSADAGFVAALQASDKDALDKLVDRTDPKDLGEVAGATVYQDGDTYFAVADDVLVLAGSRDLLDAALKRADGGDSLSEDDFEAGLEGLPDDALARLYVDVGALLNQSEGAAAARKIEWVDALRTLGLTLSATKSSVDVEFNARTEGDDLTEEDLPLATGDEAAEVVQRPNEIGVGLRDPSQLFAFFESALQAVDPDTAGDYEQGKRAIESRLDIDVQRDVVDQLTDVSVSVTLEGEFGARAELKDPAAFSATFAKVVKALPELGVGDVRRRGDLYELTSSDGGGFVFGIRDDAFVVATDARRAAQIAAARPAPVEDAAGSLVVRADAEGIARQVLAQLAPQFGIPEALVPVFARPFGELRGSVTTSTDGLEGKFKLTLD